MDVKASKIQRFTLTRRTLIENSCKNIINNNLQVETYKKILSTFRMGTDGLAEICASFRSHVNCPLRFQNSLSDVYSSANCKEALVSALRHEDTGFYCHVLKRSTTHSWGNALLQDCARDTFCKIINVLILLSVWNESLHSIRYVCCSTLIT